MQAKSVKLMNTCFMAEIFNLLHWMSGAALVILGLYCLRQSTHRLGLYLCLFLFLLATWAITAALAFNISALPIKIDFTRIRLISVALIPPILYILAKELSNNIRLSNKHLLVIFSIPTVTILILISSYHELMLTNYAIQTFGHSRLLTFTDGQWFPIHNWHSRILVLLSLYQLIRTALASQTKYQRFNRMLFLSVLFPFLTDSIAVSFFPTLRYLQLVPVTLTISAICFYYAIVKSNVLEIIPIARNLVLDSLSDIYLILDYRHKIVDFNACAKKKLDLTENSIGRSLDDLKFNKIISHIINAIDDKKTDSHFMLSYEEHQEYYSIQLDKIYNQNDVPIGTIIIVKNISEQKKYEIQLTQMAEIRTKFISLIAHDLIGNISSHGLLIELLMDHPAIKDDEDLNAQLALLLNSSQNVTKFIEALLIWSKESKENLQIKKTPSNLCEIIDESLLYLQPISLQKDINFNLNVSKNTLINIDTNMILTVCRNLLNNAIKFSPANGTVTIETTLQDGLTTVKIANEGPAIDEQGLNQFLSGFHVKSYQGGLGLTLCRDFVHLHAGEIKAKNLVPKGTAFVFTLPT